MPIAPSLWNKNTEPVLTNRQPHTCRSTAQRIRTFMHIKCEVLQIRIMFLLIENLGNSDQRPNPCIPQTKPQIRGEKNRFA